MQFRSRLTALLRNLLKRTDVERELSDELAYALDVLVKAKVTEGVPEREARRLAMIELGGVEQIKEEVRQVRMGYRLETLLRDLRYSARALLRSPGFTLTTTLTLALAIGANTAIFAVLHAVLLQSYPFPDSDKLCLISEKSKAQPEVSFSYPNYLDVKKSSRCFGSFVAYERIGYTLSYGNQAEQIQGAFCSAALFGTVGFQPQLGRTFSDAEDRPGAPPVCVISERLWMHWFNGTQQVLGTTLHLNGEPFTVVGVMPPRFDWPRNVDVWTPLGPHTTDPDWQVRSDSVGLWVIARLKSGYTLAQARVQIESIAAGLQQQYPATNTNIGLSIEPLLDAMVGEYRPGLRLLMAAVGFVLAIACANVSHLFVVRGQLRRREAAICSALGASRGMLFRQSLFESFIVVFVGGTLGVVLAAWAIPAIIAASPPGAPRFDTVSMNSVTLLFALALTVVSVLGFGLWPALQASRISSISEVLATGGGRTGTVTGRRGRHMLIAGQIALTFVLLVSAGLLIKSLQKRHALKLGYNYKNVLTAQIVLPVESNDLTGRSTSFYEELENRLSSLPGVVSVSHSTSRPLHPYWQSPFEVVGRDKFVRGEAPITERACVGIHFFDTLRIPILRGRAFNQQDIYGKLPVVIIDESFARKIWPGEDPLGKQLIFWRGQELGDVNFTVVGVVPTIRLYGAERDPNLVQAYFAHAQVPVQILSTTLLIRTRRDPSSLEEAVRREVRAIDPNQPIFAIQTFESIIGDSFSSARLYARILTLFSFVALGLAAIGLYGMITYEVVQRTKEIGIRLALGAVPSTIIRLFIKEGLITLLAGLAIGALAVIILSPLTRALLFGVRSWDVSTLVLTLALLSTVTLIACLISVRRASNVDPIIALRAE